jgi:glycosyltransferase involved in cell wall biosynthesis
MACGTPVLAMPGGSVQEVVADGVSGWVCRSTSEMASRARDAASVFKPSGVRSYVASEFSIEAMVAKYAQCYTDALNPKQAPVDEPQIASSDESGQRAAA